MKEIRKIIDTYEGVDLNKERLALASVVSVEESSYRRIGARMLVRSSGLWTGGISGGCLEGDALERSQKAIFKGEPSKVVYDTMEDDQNQIGVGLGCNGRIEVLFTPIDPNDPDNEVEQLKRIHGATKPAILLKIIDAPEDTGLLGESLLFTDEALRPSDWLGIPTDRLAAWIEQVAGEHRSRTFLTPVEAGEVKVLVEFLRPETRLIVVGDNYDVTAMLEVANVLGWETYVVGKAKKMSKEMVRLARRVVDYAQADELLVNEYTAVMIMTHDYNKDQAMVPLLAAKSPRYMGMLGPKKRFHKLNNDLPDVDLEQLSFFYSPTGLEIGAESPEEIALSIAAEIVAVFRDKPAGFLRDKEGTIHERDYATA
jgi:xanthine/CO dehydrogenase XdhC/CoxF family maturation factor